MKILLLGLNHKTAPVEVRERLAFDSQSTVEALTSLKQRFGEGEFVLLSTCNRVELYCADSVNEPIEADELLAFLARFQDVEPSLFRQYLYIHENEDAVRHLLTVASSLDSMVVGEAQIIGQVKDSYRLACSAKSTSKVLNRLFHNAFYTSKRVLSCTSISSGRVSVAGVAVELAMQLFADITAAKVVVIGAGEMGELIVQHLLDLGCRSITVVNRTFERGQAMAGKYSIGVDKWENLSQRLSEANIAIASAAVQDYLYTKKDFAKAVRRPRSGGALLLVDVAVPRNFDPKINRIDNVYLYSIDELSQVAEQNRKSREEDITSGLEIAYEQAAEFMDWFGSRDIGPLIGQMKAEFVRIGESELQRFFVGVRRDAGCRSFAEQMVNRIVNKLVHCVIKNVDVVTKKHGPAEAARMVDQIVRQAGQIAGENGVQDDNNTDNE